MEQGINAASASNAAAANYMQARTDAAPTTVDGAAVASQAPALARISCTGFDRTPPMPPSLPPWGPAPDTRDLIDVLRDLIGRLEQVQPPTHAPVQVPQWALGRYGDSFLPAVGMITVRGHVTNNAVPFGMVEGTVGTLEEARQLMRDRSSVHDSYTLGIVEVVVGDDVAFQVVRLNSERLEQQQRHAGWRGLRVTRRAPNGDVATLRLVDTNQSMFAARTIIDFAEDRLPMGQQFERGAAARRNG